MSSRGRGRGRGSYKPAGYSKLEDDPPIDHPPPLYPPLQFKPVPLFKDKENMLKEMERMQNMLDIKQKIKSCIRESGYFIPPVSTKKDIYFTDKYQQLPAAEQIIWDKSLFPKELFELPRKKRKKMLRNGAVKKSKISENDEGKEGGEKKSESKELQVLEAKETEENEEDEEEEAENEEEEYDEDELEEETDYATNYFDNGENYLDDEDNNLDEGYEY